MREHLLDDLVDVGLRLEVICLSACCGRCGIATCQQRLHRAPRVWDSSGVIEVLGSRHRVVEVRLRTRHVPSAENLISCRDQLIVERRVADSGDQVFTGGSRHDRLDGGTEQRTTIGREIRQDVRRRLVHEQPGDVAVHRGNVTLCRPPTESAADATSNLILDPETDGLGDQEALYQREDGRGCLVRHPDRVAVEIRESNLGDQQARHRLDDLRWAEAHIRTPGVDQGRRGTLVVDDAERNRCRTVTQQQVRRYLQVLESVDPRALLDHERYGQPVRKRSFRDPCHLLVDVERRSRLGDGTGRRDGQVVCQTFGLA